MIDYRMRFRERMQTILDGYSGVEEFSRNMDISGPTVRGWISGRALPSADLLVWIAYTHNVSIDWLLGLSNDRDRKWEDL